MAVGKPANAQEVITDLAAVVTVTDDGVCPSCFCKGSHMLPPGDLRNCMVALSEEEALLARLFNHRFKAGDTLRGHNFGNLFVAALTEITGDFAQAVQLSLYLWATRGRIYPATTANTTLVAEMDDGSFVPWRKPTSRQATAASLSSRSIRLHPSPLPEM